MKYDFFKSTLVERQGVLFNFCRQFRNNNVKKKNPALTLLALVLSTTAAVEFSTKMEAIANPIEFPPPAALTNSEVDTSISREYEPAVVYLPDPQTQRLVPQSVLVTTDQPVAGAVSQIIQSYEGEDMGIEGYDVNVNPSAHEAEINFDINHPRGARAFQSLSSANQYSLFEAIRETLLTQPVYSIERVIFLSNGVSFDI